MEKVSGQVNLNDKLTSIVQANEQRHALIDTCNILRRFLLAVLSCHVEHINIRFLFKSFRNHTVTTGKLRHSRMSHTKKTNNNRVESIKVR